VNSVFNIKESDEHYFICDFDMLAFLDRGDVGCSHYKLCYLLSGSY
jgi:hypothetical protein